MNGRFKPHYARVNRTTLRLNLALVLGAHIDPCTTTRFSSGSTRITSPRFPLSSERPLMTSTSITFANFDFHDFAPVSLALEHFRCQRDDFHKTFFTQFARHRAKNAGALADSAPSVSRITAALSSKRMLEPSSRRHSFAAAHNHSFHNFALLHRALRRSRFDRGNHDITHTSHTGEWNHP